VSLSITRLTSVTRIIAGAVGSLRLKGPAKATRPTSDRVKESVFSVLETMKAIFGAEVIDLYAGTGALGLEAASRGASRVTLVEKDKSAAEVCKANLEAVKSGLQKAGIECSLTIVTSSAESFLKQQKVSGLVFVDPPYDLPQAQVSEQIERLFRLGAELVVLERSAKERNSFSEAIKTQAEKNYGDTKVYFLTRRDAL
jgi:16S rRNA (guanine966-N2)-methyltransferase